MIREDHEMLDVVRCCPLNLLSACISEEVHELLLSLSFVLWLVHRACEEFVTYSMSVALFHSNTCGFFLADFVAPIDPIHLRTEDCFRPIDPVLCSSLSR